MNLSQANLGDQFRIFVDGVGNISTLPSMNTLLATVIAIKKSQYGSGLILGWKKHETHPPECTTRGNISIENDYVPNQKEYVYGKAVKRDMPVAIQIFNGLDGFPCKKCTNFFPLSSPNQKDGTLICWSCRNS